jgi:hypothetical protein
MLRARVPRIGAAGAAPSTYILSANSGSFSISGNDAALKYNRRLVADAANYTLAGQDAAFKYNRMLACNVANYAIVARDAGLLYSGSPPSILFVDWILFARRKKRR